MDREKVIRGLECCSDVGGKHCYEGKCPYASMSEPCREQLAQDAIELLKEQEAKWVEDKQGERCRLIKCSNCGLTFIVGNNIPYDEWIEDRNYCCRCGARMVEPND